MTVYEQVLQMLDEALDYQRHGELDEYAPFDLVDDLDLDGVEAVVSQINEIKKAAQTLEKIVKQALAARLIDSDKSFKLGRNEFPAVRYGPTVYAYRPKPTDPKVVDAAALTDFAGPDISRLARFELRKKQLRALCKEWGVEVQTLIDSGLIEWESPDEGAPVLEVIDLHSQYAPKWAEKVPDEWEEE